MTSVIDTKRSNDGVTFGTGDTKSRNKLGKLRALANYILIPVQLVVGSLVLLLILCALPFLYIFSYVHYKFWYVARRERVIRGLQRKDKKQLRDVEARQESITSGPLSKHKSMYATGSQTFSVRTLKSVRKLDTNGDALDEDSIEVEERLLSNYSGTYELLCDVMAIEDEKDIIKVIKIAGRNGLSIRAMGSLFSWPNIVEPCSQISSTTHSSTSNQKDKEDDIESQQTKETRQSLNENGGVVLDMKGYSKLLKVLVLPEDEIQEDGTVALVRVQSGMKIWQLCELLDQLGYALPVLGNVTGQSVGGVISTGTHGKNIRFGTLSSIVQSMTLVLADGSIKNIAMRNERGDCSKEPLACASGVSLGLLGVISTVTLRVVPKHRLKFSISSLPFEAFLESYEEIVENSEHAAFIYFPYVDCVRIEVAKKLNKEEESRLKDRPMPRHNRTKLFFAALLNYILFESIFGHLFGPVVWLITRYIILTDLEPQASVNKPAIDNSYKVVANNVNFDIEHHEMEYGYDAKQAKEVLRAYRDVFRSFPKHFQYSSMLDIRFSNGDAAWLASSSGRQTLWLDLIRPNVHKNTDFFMNSFKPVILKYLGRPHFGKENILGADELNECFPHWADFIKMRDDLDPQKMFANPYFESLFGTINRKSWLNKQQFACSRRALTKYMYVGD